MQRQRRQDADSQITVHGAGRGRVSMETFPIPSARTWSSTAMALPNSAFVSPLMKIAGSGFAAANLFSASPSSSGVTASLLK